MCSSREGTGWNGRFSNVPAGYLPWIRFEDDLGPFQCLQLVPSYHRQGKGNVGTNASYTYTAWLLPHGDVPPISGSATVVNLQQAPNTSPEVVVRYHDGLLDVQPEELTLSPGDTAIWNVFGLPRVTSSSSGSIPCRLPGAPGGAVRDRFSPAGRWSRQAGCYLRRQLQCFRNALGYTYHIGVRNSSGIVVASHDPMIDNLGEPGPPGGSH